MKFNYKILFFILFSTIFSQLIRHINGGQLNYVHVLFEWEQIKEAVSYNFKLDNESNFSSPNFHLLF